MKKFSLVVAALVAGASLNAAVVATVNGKNITDTQINEDLAQILGGQSISSLPAPQKQGIIQDYIANQLILDEAKKQNLEKSELYKKALENAQNEILINLYQKKIFDSLKVDNAKVKAIYDKNKAQYVRPAGVRARHILVKSEKEAKDIINELKDLKGNELVQKFAQTAAAKSIDGSAQQGGELGWFSAQDMVKPFSDAAFSLKNGEISKNPVKTEFGYHIILKEDSQPRTQLTFDQVKAGIENELKLVELRQAMAKKAQELYSKAKVELK